MRRASALQLYLGLVMVCLSSILTFFFLTLLSADNIEVTVAQWPDNSLESMMANFTGDLEAKLKEFMKQHDEDHGVDPEAYLDTCGIAKYHGFVCEEYLHEVITDDGFMLTLHRINGRLGQNNSEYRPPVFVQHGLLCDSSSWVLNLVSESAPFILSDAGFDVWLGNSRGNTFSRKHKTLSPDQEKFWDWSWSEMAEYDLPSSIDFVLNKTGRSNLHYVGHSQGTLIAFTHMSSNPKHKISHLLALGPVVTVGDMISPLKYIAPFSRELDILISFLGVKDFLPSDMVMHWLARNVCSKTDLDVLCGDVLFLVCGFDKKALNETRIPVYISHTPAGTSVKNIVHFAQMVESKKCQKYDYGSADKNKAKYNGSATPPEYDISKITVPVSIFWGENDWLADPQDVQYIIKNVKTIVNNVYIPVWDHLDFIWAENSKPVLVDQLVKIIKSDLGL